MIDDSISGDGCRNDTFPTESFVIVYYAQRTMSHYMHAAVTCDGSTDNGNAMNLSGTPSQTLTSERYSQRALGE